MSTGGWEAARLRVRRQIGSSAFQTWFAEVEGSYEDDRLVVSCPDTFVRDWIAMRYDALLQKASGARPGIVYRARKSAQIARGSVRSQESVAPSPSAAPASESSSPSAASERTFGNFVGGQENALALEAARSLLGGELGGCNPLLINGPSGVGKSHLCEAIQNAHQESVLYRSSEEFTSEVTQGIRGNRMAEIRHRYRRAANVLILEDIQFLENKKATQIELFHTLEHLVSRGRPVVLTCDRPPHQLHGLDEKLRSRLASGLVANMVPPEIESRIRILRESASAGGVHLTDSCLEILANRPVHSTRDLLSGLTQVVARATLLRRAIDEALVHESLGAISAPSPRRSIEAISSQVAASFGLSLDQLRTRSRKAKISRPRQIAMFLCRRFTDASLQEIADLFDRDHSTVSYAIEVVENRTLTKPQLRYELQEIATRLGLS